MAFQIAYVFEFIDKYSKVSSHLIRRIGAIERSVKKTGKGFKEFAVVANNSLDKVRVKSTQLKKRLESVNRSEIKARHGFEKFAKSAEKSSRKMQLTLDMLNKSIKKSSREMNRFQKVSGKGFKEFRAEALRAELAQQKLSRATKKQTILQRMQNAIIGNLKFRLASLAVTLAMSGMRLLVDKAKPINKAFVIMSSLTGIVGKDLDFLNKKAFQFARVLGVPLEDVATGFKRVAGLKPELLENVEALAELTKWTLILDAPMEQIEKVSRALVVSLNVYGKTAASAAEHTNILAAAQRKGSAEVIDMALSFLKSGPVAETAAVPFIKLISAIQALGRSGVLKQMAGTSLRTIMIRVAKQSQDSGETFIDVLTRMRDEVFAVEGRLARIEIASKFFGVRQAAAGLILLKNIEFMKEFEQSIKGSNIALDTAKITLSSYEREVNKIWAVWDKTTKNILEDAAPGLLKLHRSWVAFITGLTMAPPLGLGTLISLMSELLADIIDIGNAFLIFWNMVTSPLELTKGWDAFLKRWEDIGILWDLMVNESPQIETIMKAGEIAGEGQTAATGKTGRVQVDVNLRGNTEVVESATATTEGNAVFDTGLNFAY